MSLLQTQIKTQMAYFIPKTPKEQQTVCLHSVPSLICPESSEEISHFRILSIQQPNQPTKQHNDKLQHTKQPIPTHQITNLDYNYFDTYLYNNYYNYTITIHIYYYSSYLCTMDIFLYWNGIKYIVKMFNIIFIFWCISCIYDVIYTYLLHFI